MEAAGVELITMLTARKLLILGSATRAKKVRCTPALIIRKFTSRHYTVDDLIARGTPTRALADFLAEQIRSGKTLLISGGTGTGKTTLLRILTDFIPEQDRLVVIEDTSELQIQKPNILPTEWSPLCDSANTTDHSP